MSMYIWAKNATNVANEETFQTKYLLGFEAGTKTESAVVNAILRQNSMIAQGLLDGLSLSGTTISDFTSFVTDEQSLLANINKISVKIRNIVSNSATASNLSSRVSNLDTRVKSLETKSTQQANSISNIIAKNTTQDNDIADIKRRLDELGFKSGQVTFLGTNIGPSTTNYVPLNNANGIYKSGKIAYCHINTTHTFISENEFTDDSFFKLPAGFRLVSSSVPISFYIFCINRATNNISTIEAILRPGYANIAVVQKNNIEYNTSYHIICDFSFICE